MFPAFPAHAQSAILCIWQEAHCSDFCSWHHADMVIAIFNTESLIIFWAFRKSCQYIILIFKSYHGHCRGCVICISSTLYMAWAKWCAILQFFLFRSTLLLMKYCNNEVWIMISLSCNKHFQRLFVKNYICFYSNFIEVYSHGSNQQEVSISYGRLGSEETTTHHLNQW